MKLSLLVMPLLENPTRVYNLRLNIFMEVVHVVFDDKKITGLLDDGNHELLHFGNEVNTDLR